jgi:hypothetical protein
MTADDGTVAGALVKLADHAGQLDVLQQRVTGLTDTLDELQGLASRLAEQLEGDPGSDGIPYRPCPAPRWWELAAGDREKAVDRLARWIEAIYRPGYGQQAARLPGCWREHEACLTALDWLSELWQVLYLQNSRTAQMLSGQAEWQTRLLPAAADAMAEEARKCRHPKVTP